MSVKAQMNGVTVDNATSLPIKNKNGITIGTLVLSEVGTIPTPTATKTISANGTGIDVTNYAKVDVSVPTSGGTTPRYQEKTVTTNGTVTPDSGYDALSKVTVNVTQTGITPSGSKQITENGTYDVTQYASAVVDVPTSGGVDDNDYYLDMELIATSDFTISDSQKKFLTTAWGTTSIMILSSYTGVSEKVSKIINAAQSDKCVYFCSLEYIGDERTDLQNYLLAYKGLSYGLTPSDTFIPSAEIAGAYEKFKIEASEYPIFEMRVRDTGVEITARFQRGGVTVVPSGKYRFKFGRV